jgi:hypothetical protein
LPLLPFVSIQKKRRVSAPQGTPRSSSEANRRSPREGIYASIVLGLRNYFEGSW